MTDRKPSEAKQVGAGGAAAFLLSQIGAHGARLFAERMSRLGLTPGHGGLFRVLVANPGMTQKELADALGTLPNRIVGLVDELEAKGLLARKVQPQDRRRHALVLTEAGREMGRAISEVARDHQAVLLDALDDNERAQLANLLQRVADQQGLIRGVHPGYARRWK